jgi:predicted alpha/beta hydrolase family esterase
VASRNDPLGQFEKIAGLARAWGAELHDAGDVGHLNPAAGYGRWDGALPLLDRLATA